MRPPFQDHWQHVRTIVDASLRAASPDRLVETAVRANPPRTERVAVIAIGKAAAGMYEGFVRVHGEPQDRIMVLPHGASGPDWARRASHPVPAEDSVRAAEAIASFIRERAVVWAGGEPGSFVLLLSGGASALTALPMTGLTLEDLQKTTSDLLRAGADIRELNWVRKHLEQLKGGRLAALVAPFPLDVHALSDVIGDDRAVIGSGQAWPDGSTYSDALDILNRRGVAAMAVRRFLREGDSGQHPETPKPGDPVFAAVRYGIVGNNSTAVTAAMEAAASLGFTTTRRREPLLGEAAIEGVGAGMRLAGLQGPACVVYGGETTVRVGRAAGEGGRNQELALAAALDLDGKPGCALVAFATDGVDGPTDAAGAVVTGHTCEAARKLGLDPRTALTGHDSHGFFRELERGGEPCLIRTGPTGTNVNDLVVALAYEESPASGV